LKKVAHIADAAEVFKALSDPTRLKLLGFLTSRSQERCDRGGEAGCGLCVAALTRKLGVTQSAVSQHLRTLKQAGLVRAERRGTFMHYSLDADVQRACLAALKLVLGPARDPK
jgi:ArsR family transcriptional regulator